MIRAFRMASSQTPVRRLQKIQSSFSTLRPNLQYKAVVFDMGGVLIPGPGKTFSDFEKKAGLEKGTLTKSIMAAGQQSAWARMEKGQFASDQLGVELSKDIATMTGLNVDCNNLMNELHDAVTESFPEMLAAVEKLRMSGYKTALLTNNWIIADGKSENLLPFSQRYFDHVIESCRVGYRKPESEIYKILLDKLACQPHETIFLDDLGINLKPAAQIGIKTIKVITESRDSALTELSNLTGVELSSPYSGTEPVPQHLQLDMSKLKSYLRQTLGKDCSEIDLRSYKHGQSNPTYLLKYDDTFYVLRKQPPGKILPSAHAVDREYQVMAAVRDHGVPVPRMVGYCGDKSVVGTPFYVMEHVQGKIYKDLTLSELTAEQRNKVYSAACEVLSKIHKVNISAAGLDKFGKKTDYMQRNLSRWVKQYEKSKTREIPAMDYLMKHLYENLPKEEMCTVIHGDFRIDNLIFDPVTLEVLAVLDWELSTLGNPIQDICGNLLQYITPADAGAMKGFIGLNMTGSGIPTFKEYVQQYCDLMGLKDIRDPPIDYYMSFMCFRLAAIAQGVYKRFIDGQSSSPTAETVGLLCEPVANTGMFILQDGLDSILNMNKHSSDSTHIVYDRLPVDVTQLRPIAQKYHERVKQFINDHVLPIEQELVKHQSSEARWSVPHLIEDLKAKAKAEGLWNLFIPIETDRDQKYGAGLTNLEYAFICEEMGRCPIAPEVFNCSAPDTGNMEVFIKYGTESQKDKWLKPLLEGEIRSCFGMTEPAVASSDATNIQSSIRRHGDSYIVNGRKWWTSGACDPRCKVCIFMGKTDTEASKHRQQSMIIVPMDAPGVEIIQPLFVFGSQDAPAGHAEVQFTNVRVPSENMLMGEGRGFEIAQGRLGPGRIHHCMRLIGNCERAIELMVSRTTERKAFGKPLIAQGTIQADIANSRIELEQARLLVLKAAHMMDTVGNKVAAPEIAMIKVAVPNVAQKILDRAIQMFGGAGFHTDYPLSAMFVWARVLRIADGPDEVHRRAIARYEIMKQNKSKL